MNRDGHIDEHGFSACIISVKQELPEFSLTMEEITAVFKLTSYGRVFRYADFMAEIDENLLKIIKEMIPNYEAH